MESERRRSVDEWETESVAVSEGRYARVGAMMVSDVLAEVGDGKVRGWMRGQTGGFGGRVGSDSGDDDDGDGSSDGAVVDGGGMRAAEIVEGSVKLRAVSAEWQTGVQARVYSMLQRGRFPSVSPDRSPEVPQLLFKCSRVVAITELETAGGLYEELRNGVVIANVVAPTGIGKSTVFSMNIANKVGCRVLQISPDIDLKTRHGNAMRAKVPVSRYWTPEKGPRVCFMTPQEFCGRFFGDGWDEMLSMFDVLVLDEAHIPLKYYYGVREAVSTKARGRLSMLMLSATAVGQGDLQSTRATPLFVPKLLEEIASDEDFADGEYAVDGSMFVVESDERVNRVADLLAATGCVVLTLESGASSAAIDRVSEELHGDSAAVRLLVAHERFGTAHNLPVTRVVTTGMRQIIVKDGKGGFESKAVPLSIAEVKQHLARANRGIVASNHRGVVLLDMASIGPQVDLIESERFGAYVLLRAMGIIPTQKLAKVAEEELPSGITRRMAVAIVNMFGVPAEVAVRFMAKDGRFPAAYAAALRGFSAETASTLSTELSEVVHEDLWVEAPGFSVFGEEAGPKVRVPFAASGELGVIVLLVCAAAQRLFQMNVTKARPDDGYVSGPEGTSSVKGKKWRALTYRPVPLEVREVSESKVVVEKPRFALSVDADVQPVYRRRGYSQFPAGVADALRLEGEPRAEEFVDARGRPWIRVFSGDVETSPVRLEGSGGGGESFEIPKPLWAGLISGDPLFGKDLNLLLKVLEADRGGCFATSVAFSNWNNCWLSALRTFCQPENVEKVQAVAAMELVTVFLTRLWERYVLGMHHAVQVSHWSVTPWQKLVSKFTEGRKLAAVQRGETVDVAQSQLFLQRLYDIRLHFSLALSVLEDKGFFNAAAVSELQRVLPISRSVGEGTHDAVRKGKAGGHGRFGRVRAGRHERVGSGSTREFVEIPLSPVSKGGFLVDLTNESVVAGGTVSSAAFRSRFERK